MKKAILILTFVCALFCTAAVIKDVKLRWDANTDTNTFGYTLYEKLAVGSNFLLHASGKQTTNATVTNVLEGLHTYFLTAWDGEGTESKPSNTASTPPGLAPQIQGVIIEVINP